MMHLQCGKDFSEGFTVAPRLGEPPLDPIVKRERGREIGAGVGGARETRTKDKEQGRQEGFVLWKKQKRCV